MIKGPMDGASGDLFVSCPTTTFIHYYANKVQITKSLTLEHYTL